MENNKSLINVVIFGLVAILCSAIFSNAYKNRNRTNDVISVTGAAKQDFVSDLIEWNMDITRTSMDLKTAFAAISADAQEVKKFLLQKGIKADEVIMGAVNIRREHDTEYDTKGNSRQVFRGFKLTQNVKVESNDIEKVEVVSREITGLIDAGLEVYSKDPNYYYTKLGELKIQMIAEATKDGRIRAEQIAKNAGGKISGLRYSNLGIFQITGQNTNTDYSWGGSFDTASKRKTASITVKLQFGL